MLKDEKMKKWDVYAPVIIPTLCRYEHFIRCIESLRRCTGAEYTEVFVGLDYPANESHWDGYQKICSYVETVKGFKSFNVIKRKENYGAIKNIRSLREIVLKNYDRWIYSEDDNEFAPNFLEYINAGLERYKDNPQILRICGCVMPWNADYDGCMRSYPYNAFPAMDYNALGCGTWANKNFSLPFSKISILNSWKLTFKTILNGYPAAISRFLHQLHKESQLFDVCLRLYCAFNNKYCIFPRISKVKNWGYDGTGINSDDNPHWMEVQTLDTSTDFEFDDFEIKEYEEVKRFLRQMYDAPPGHSRIKRRLIVLKRYIFFRLTGIRIQDIPDGQRARNYLLNNFANNLRNYFK